MPDSGLPSLPPQLAPRDRDVLRDVIRAYILTGEPVSSRSVAKGERLGVSAATIRNVMADLEDLGYLAQPHTSAGRVPTAAGYHLFIESLMETRELLPEERRFIDESLRGGGVGADELVASTGHVLSRLTGQAAIVLIPALGATVLKAVDFVPMGGRRVLCVVVSASGFVDSKPIELEEPLAREELVRIGNYLTENFAGLTLAEIRDRLLGLMAQERAQVDRLMSLAIALGRQGLQPGEPGLRVDGAAALLARPELANLERVRRVLDAFQEKARLVQMLNRCVDGRGVRVFIGEDTELTSELDFSLVATTYGVGHPALGSLGIFGPSRMDYHRIIPLVHYLADKLGQGLRPGEGS